MVSVRGACVWLAWNSNIAVTSRHYELFGALRQSTRHLPRHLYVDKNKSKEMFVHIENNDQSCTFIGYVYSIFHVSELSFSDAETFALNYHVSSIPIFNLKYFLSARLHLFNLMWMINALCVPRDKGKHFCSSLIIVIEWAKCDGHYHK